MEGGGGGGRNDVSSRWIHVACRVKKGEARGVFYGARELREC